MKMHICLFSLVFNLNKTYLNKTFIILYVLFLPSLISWLLQDKKMKLRTTYSGFTTAVNSYFDKLIPRVTPLQVRYVVYFLFCFRYIWLVLVLNLSPLLSLQYKNGGPIIAVQVENEYGSYAKDEQYMSFIKEVWNEIKSLSLTLHYGEPVLVNLQSLFSKSTGVTVPGSLRASPHIRQP